MSSQDAKKGIGQTSLQYLIFCSCFDLDTHSRLLELIFHKREKKADLSVSREKGKPISFSFLVVLPYYSFRYQFVYFDSSTFYD